MLALLQAADLSLPPVELHLIEIEPALADALIEAQWEGRHVRFLAAVKKLATPKSLRLAAVTAQEAASPPGTYPMVIVPYLSFGKLQELEAAGVSGLDLCGNGVLVVPGTMLVFRSGQPNRFPQSAKLRNVYRGKSSLVGRAFLLRPEFPQVKDLVILLKERGGSVAFSTVSKALKRLEEELVISRQGGSIRLMQADVLMDNLASNYEAPATAERLRGKHALPREEFIQRLTTSAWKKTGKLILTGSASSERYATMAGEPAVSLYTTLSPRSLLAAPGLDVQETDRFPNVEILRTDDARAFFDPRVEGGIPYASPIQTWLELASGDKRQKDAAKQVRLGILASLGHVADDGRP